MRSAVILHGICDANEYFDMDFPSPSNAHWLPALQQKFLRDGVLCQTPEMPSPYNPIYEAWDQTFSLYSKHFDDQSIIVAHSAGCGFVLKWLATNHVTLAKLVLVAPFLDPYHKYDDFLRMAFLPNLNNRVPNIHVFYSEDESVKGVAESVELIHAFYIEATIHRYTDQEHFCFTSLDTKIFHDLWTAARP